MRRHTFAVLAAMTAVSAAVLAQSAQSQPAADPRVAALIAQADRFSHAQNFDEAHARADEALALSEKIGDRLSVAMSCEMKGIVLYRQGRDGLSYHERALTEFEALGNKRGMADALASLGRTALVRGDNAKAREFAKRALQLYDEIGDLRGRGRMLVHFSPDDVSKTADNVAAALDIAQRLGDDHLRAQAFKLRADVAFNASNYSLASKAYQDAIAAFEKTADLHGLAATYLSLGRVFRAHGDYDGAIRHYQKAIDVLGPTKERLVLVQATNAKAIALSYQKRFRESLLEYERALALARESDNQRLIDFMEGNLAGALLESKEYERAIPALRAVIAKKPEPRLLAYRQNSLAMALANVGRFEEAAPYLDEAVSYSRRAKEVDLLASRLDNRAWVLSRLGQYEPALADAREVISIYEQVRTSLLPSDFLKQGFGRLSEGAYTRVVDLLSWLNRPDEALEFAEKGRSRAFLDLLAARAENDGPSTTRGRAEPSSEVAGEPLALVDLRKVPGRLGSTVISYLVTDEATLIWVVPPDGQLRHARVPISRDALATHVASTTAALRADTGATTRGAGDITAVPMRGLGMLALSRDRKVAWRDLYRLLIEPVRGHLPAPASRLTIVPHGPLFQLSFAALQDPTGRYLLESYEVHYAPSLSVLDFTHRRQGAALTNAQGPWAIVGNPSELPTAGQHPLSPLPGAAREIAMVSTLAPKGQSLRLDRAGADEAALIKTVRTSRPAVLHFATHGFVFDDPRQSPFLAMNRRGETDADDGRLTLDEVYGLRLDTDLVVLSACRSGSGQVSSDGVIGLTRGFFYAGAPSVVATFWDVVDEATANLMSGFYRGYVKGREKSRSLRAAQLALLRDLRAGKVIVTAGGRKVTLPEHPLLWAAFFLSGEP